MLNGNFLITWSRDNEVRSTTKDGVGELSEFIRNCDAYDRKILKIETI